MVSDTIASPDPKKTAIETAAILCRAFEGFRAKPYLCPAGIPTIGYGSTHYPDGSPVRLTDAPVTREQADAYLTHELTRLAPWVVALCPTLHGNRLAAILDFAYNIGVGRLRASTLRRRINAQDWPAARAELRRWVRGGGRILPGLVRRREAEIALI